MRRTDRERNDTQFFEHVFQNAEVLYLALNDGAYPYCLPVNFAYADNRIYVHSALEGHKLDCIAKNPHIAFSAAIDIQIDQAKFTTYYKSLCGTGEARIIQDQSEKKAALELIGSRYKALCPNPAPASTVNRIAIIRIDIHSITGKAHLEKQA